MRNRCQDRIEDLDIRSGGVLWSTYKDARDNLTCIQQMSSPRTGGILSLIRFNSGQDKDV